MDYAFNAKIHRHYLITDQPSGAVHGRPCFRRWEIANFAHMRPDEISWCFEARLEDPLFEISFPTNWPLFRLQEREDSFTPNREGAKKAKEIIESIWGKKK